MRDTFWEDTEVLEHLEHPATRQGPVEPGEKPIMVLNRTTREERA
jgi:hypothetical protein